ncbi:MAG: hypothetical protein ACYTEQ_30885 [Planctomycetota bacterium]|jgi:hypothetical protein
MHTLTTVMGRYLLAIGVFIIFALWFLWFTHTAELRLSREIVYRSKNDVIEISVELGGATSQIHKAALTLKGTAGNELDMSALRDSIYQYPNPQSEEVRCCRIGGSTNA